MKRRTVLRAMPVATTAVLAGCSGGNGSDDPVVSVTMDWFDPIQRSVDVGATVTWVNEDNTILPEHTVQSKRIHDAATAWEFEATLEESGDEASHTFDREGVYTYVDPNSPDECLCGAILVGDASLDDPSALYCEPVSGGGCAN